MSSHRISNDKKNVLAAKSCTAVLQSVTNWHKKAEYSEAVFRRGHTFFVLPLRRNCTDVRNRLNDSRATKLSFANGLLLNNAGANFSLNRKGYMFKCLDEAGFRLLQKFSLISI